MRVREKKKMALWANKPQKMEHSLVKKGTDEQATMDATRRARTTMAARWKKAAIEREEETHTSGNKGQRQRECG